MRVVHLSTFDIGGAARSTLRLHAGLLRLGIESDLLARTKATREERVHGIDESWLGDVSKEIVLLEAFQNWYINRNRTELSNTHFSLGEPGLNIASHPLVRDAEVIHLHWVAGLLSPRALFTLARLGKPIVWTLHDMRPMTGGCHFSAGCDKFTTTCTGCPQVAWDPYLLSELQLADQKDLFPADQLTIVCPSKWLMEAAQRSAIFARSRIVHIPYSIDNHLFAPREKAQSRQELGLPQEGTFILFAADNAGEKRKGFRFLVEALKQIQTQTEWNGIASKNGLALLCLGHASPEVESLGLPVHALGYIKDDHKVSLAYGASDVFVLPSLEDNLPNTVMESISCGRPVVAFGAGGIPDMVQDGVNGFLAMPGDAAGLAKGIMELVGSPGLRTRFGAAGREFTLDRYRLETQAHRYKALYEELPANPVLEAPPSAPFAEVTDRIREVLYKSLPGPALDHLFTRETEFRHLVQERQSHVATMSEQREYIDQLKARAEASEKAYKQLLQQRPVKTLRKLKLIKMPRQ